MTLNMLGNNAVNVSQHHPPGKQRQPLFRGDGYESSERGGGLGEWYVTPPLTSHIDERSTTWMGQVRECVHNRRRILFLTGLCVVMGVALNLHNSVLTRAVGGRLRSTTGNGHHKLQEVEPMEGRSPYNWGFGNQGPFYLMGNGQLVPLQGSGPAQSNSNGDSSGQEAGGEQPQQQDQPQLGPGQQVVMVPVIMQTQQQETSAGKDVTNQQPPQIDALALAQPMQTLSLNTQGQFMTQAASAMEETRTKELAEKVTTVVSTEAGASESAAEEAPEAEAQPSVETSTEVATTENNETPPVEASEGDASPEESSEAPAEEVPQENGDRPTDADMEQLQSEIPLKELDNFKDAWDPYELSDNPVFWHIPKAGGSTVKDIIGTCHRFVMATEFGITDGHADDPEIAVVYPGGGPVGQDRSPFVNVDTTTISGIERAKEMGFADSGLADAVVTPFIYEANDLFTQTAKGRLFTVFRHPIDRAISLFYYLQVADWEPTYNPDMQNWSIEEYAKSDVVENNWMTRQLSNKFEGDLDDSHLKIAMEVIRRKFLVGLMTEIEKTMNRLEKYFRWTFHVNPPNQEKCRESLLSGGSNKNSSGNKKEKPQPGSEAWMLLEHQNLYDLQLYEYIEVLFEEQEAFVTGIEEDYRNIDATCCKCSPPTYPPEGFNCPLAILN